MLKTRFIVNLHSGKAARAFPDVQAFAALHRATVAVTERARHGADLARRAIDDGCELIVAVGGDGTMNEIAGALIDSPAILGLIPCGSGDGLGRHLRIHGPVSHALRVLETGRVRAIDSGMADGHPFFTAAGLGFEAEIANRFNRLERRGFLRYISTSTQAYRAWQPFECTIEHNGTRERVQAFTLAVGNSDQYGNDAHIAPGARIDDGVLNLTVVPPVTAWNGVPLLYCLFRGTLGGVRGVQLRQATRFIVERTSAGLIHTDGELHEAGPVVEFTVCPRSLRIMTPADKPSQA